MKRITRKPAAIIAIFAVLLVLVLVLLFFREDSDASGMVPFENYNADPNAVTQAGDDIFRAAISEDAWFYFEGSLVKYYDPALKKSLIFCSRSNCLHNNIKCEAYFPGRTSETSPILGVIPVGEYICVIYKEAIITLDHPVSYQVVRIDPKNGTRKVMAEFMNSAFARPDDGKEYCSGVNSVNTYACNGCLWILDQSMMIPGKTMDDDPLRWTRNICIDVNTGKTIVIGNKDFECQILTIGSGYVIYCHNDYNEKKLYRKEFYDIIESGEVIRINENSFTDYNSYSSYASQNIGYRCTYYLYDMNNGTSKVLFESKSVLTDRSHKNAFIKNQYGLKTVSGSYNDMILVKELIPDKNGEYSFFRFSASLYNVKDGSSEQIIKTENGHLPHSMNGGLNGILPDGFVIVYQYNADHSKTEVWIFDTNTKELRYLYTEEDLGYIFRVEGVYKDGYIGKIYQLNGRPEGAVGNGTSFSYAWISQEDFLNGNMDKIVKYTIK